MHESLLGLFAFSAFSTVLLCMLAAVAIFAAAMVFLMLFLRVFLALCFFLGFFASLCRSFRVCGFTLVGKGDIAHRETRNECSRHQRRENLFHTNKYSKNELSPDHLESTMSQALRA